MVAKTHHNRDDTCPACLSAMLKAEFHAHTADDPIDRIPHTSNALIDRAAELGYAALAITLHDKQLDVRPLEPYAAERGIVLIPGVERTVNGRHILLINFREGAETVRTFDDIRQLKRRSPGLVIAPHAFFPARTCLRGLLDQHADVFDAIEYNAMFTRHMNFNRAAVEWATRHQRPLVGCGDIHRLHQLGTTFSLVEAERDRDAICTAVAEGRVRVESRPLGWTAAARTMSELMLDEWRPGKHGHGR
jgi:predicted metal-dependent phosphoesterase TrpH